MNHTHEEPINPYVESLNYLVLIAQDYINTLPVSSKVAVTKQATESLETLKRVIEGYTTLERALHDCQKGKRERPAVEPTDE